MLEEKEEGISTIIQEALKEASDRRDMGLKKYGANDFMDKDMMLEARAELLDLINYSLFMIVKLQRLSDKGIN